MGTEKEEISEAMFSLGDMVRIKTNGETGVVVDVIELKDNSILHGYIVEGETQNEDERYPLYEMYHCKENELERI